MTTTTAQASKSFIKSKKHARHASPSLSGPALAVLASLALPLAAHAEAPTLGTAIALIAKHRLELDAAMRAAELKHLPVATEGAAEQRAIAKLAAAAEGLRVVDKTA